MSQNPGMNAPYGQQPGYPAPGAIPASSSGGGLVPGAALAILGGIAAVVGVFLTWAKVALSVSAGGESQSYNLTLNGLGKFSGAPDTSGITANGAVDGYVIIAGGAIALIGGIILLASKKSAGAILAIVGGLVALGFAIYELTQVGKIEEGIRDQASAAVASGLKLNVDASAGIGLWIILIGGAAALIGAFIALAGRRKLV